jgi:hypothetical protein
LFIKKWMSWKRQSLTQFAVEPQNRGRAPKPRLSLNIPTFEIAPYCVHKKAVPARYAAMAEPISLLHQPDD